MQPNPHVGVLWRVPHESGWLLVRQPAVNSPELIAPRSSGEDPYYARLGQLAWPVVVAFLVWLYSSENFQFVDSHPWDVLVVALGGLGLSALVRMSRHPRAPFLSWDYGSQALTAALLLAALVPLLNALPDRQPARQFPTLVKSGSCYRGGCEWIVSGAPSLPAASTSITVRSFLVRDQYATPGDSILVSIRPGFIGRAWIASWVVHPVHHVGRS